MQTLRDVATVASHTTHDHDTVEHVERPPLRALARRRRLQVDRLDRLVQRHRADQNIRQARPGLRVELLGEYRTAQIGLQQQHPRTHFRRRPRQVTRDRRLAIARSSRGDEQRAQLPIDVEVAQMRTDQLEGLRLARMVFFVCVLGRVLACE